MSQECWHGRGCGSGDSLTDGRVGEHNESSSRLTISQVALLTLSCKTRLRRPDYLGVGADAIVEAQANALGKEFETDFNGTVEIETVTIDAVLSEFPAESGSAV